MIKVCFQFGLGICFFFLLIFFIFLFCIYDSLEFEFDCSGVIVFELIEVQVFLCNQNIGSIKVGVSNNVDFDFSFFIDGVNFQVDGSFNGLVVGLYIIIVVSNGCEEKLMIQVENVEGLNVFISNIIFFDCEGSMGIIEFNVMDVSGVVEYQINGSILQSSNIFNNLVFGIYNLMVSDEVGCDFSLEVIVSFMVEFVNIEFIINNFCVISGCYVGNVLLDFCVKNNILDNVNKIKVCIIVQSMFFSSSGISLIFEEIELISCWVNDGVQG